MTENKAAHRNDPPTGKGAETRARILETSLRLFRERGYEGTTMRAIARDAGVSVGNAYYYFASKEILIQAFYARTHDEHLEASREVLVREKDFEARLLGVLHAKLRTIEPYHRFSGILFKTAADPESPLNPFSDASRPTRRESTALFEQVIAGTKLDTPSDLWDELPNLLWIYHMGIVLFWIHDRSPGRQRTHTLVRHTVPLISRIVRLGSLPLLRSLVRRTTAFLHELREEVGVTEIPAEETPHNAAPTAQPGASGEEQAAPSTEVPRDVPAEAADAGAAESRTPGGASDGS